VVDTKIVSTNIDAGYVYPA